MSGEFDLPLLQAISDWQRGGDEKQSRRRAAALKVACASLPDEYKMSSLVCYRQIALPPEGVWALIGDNCLPEKISSWTSSIEVAKAFKGGVPNSGQGFQGTILYLFPSPGSVIVNLERLYRNPDFVTAMERNSARIGGYSDGAGRWRNSQFEVVLEIDTVTPEDVFSLGGHSSPLANLVAEAADLVYRRPTTQKEKQALFLQAQQADIAAGPRWLNMDATRRVLANTKPHVERLAEIKRQQDSG